MHKIKHVWEKITSLENIEEAIVRASEKKKKRKLVQKILSNKRQYALQIQRMLIDKTFTPTPYIPVKIRDGASGKERLIHKPIRCFIGHELSGGYKALQQPLFHGTVRVAVHLDLQSQGGTPCSM